MAHDGGAFCTSGDASQSMKCHVLDLLASVSSTAAHCACVNGQGSGGAVCRHTSAKLSHHIACTGFRCIVHDQPDSG